VAFLYPGQGSQYAAMLSPLRAIEPLVDAALTDADVALEPVLGAPLSALVDGGLANTAIAQAAVISADLALDRLLRAYGITPDVVAGHSLGEYAAVVAAGALTPDAALEVVSAIPNAAALDAVAPLSATDSPPRLPLASFDGAQPGHSSMSMAAILAPGDVIAPVLRSIDGHVDIASLNSHHSTVIGGETDAVERAVAAFTRTDIDCVPLPVAAAFHTPMVADAMPALRRALVRSRLRPPVLPVIANLTGRPYPTGKGALPKVLDTLALQFAAPMSFIACVETLWDMGVRAFVEVGPKRVVHGFVEDVLADRDATITYTNHPKTGDVASFNAALCALYAAGLGA
jgi:acyl transferase domain-containing protein